MRLGELGGHAAGPYLPNTFVMIGVVQCTLHRSCTNYALTAKVKFSRMAEDNLRGNHCELLWRNM
jgi:hypothetical protein